MTDTNYDWLCPISAARRVPYGANCPDYPACANAAHAHVTGRWYRANAVTDAEARGIGAIAEDVGKEDENAVL